MGPRTWADDEAVKVCVVMFPGETKQNKNIKFDKKIQGSNVFKAKGMGF